MIDTPSAAPGLSGGAVEVAPGMFLEIRKALRVGSDVYVSVSGNVHRMKFALYQGSETYSVDIACRGADEDGATFAEQKRSLILCGRDVAKGELRLGWLANGSVETASKPFCAAEEMNGALFGEFAPVLVDQLLRLEVGTARWKALRRVLPRNAGEKAVLRGHIDKAIALPSRLGAIVIGWEANRSGVPTWLEDGAGNCCDLSGAYRYRRSDVQSAMQLTGYALPFAAFKVYASSFSPNGPYKLCAAGIQGVECVSCSEISTLKGAATEVANSVLALVSSSRELIARASVFDLPLLERTIQRQQTTWQQWQAQEWVVGVREREPLLSVIVPLYGRTDLVEHQLIEFSKDHDFRQSAELLFVVDDPKILDQFSSVAGELYERYGVSFRWIWGHENRGFAGANNLGAEFARGQYLLFMNSDVIPMAPGWVSKLVSALDQQPSLGAVGPRLLFAGGGIQHAGMRPVWNERLGIWHNQHIMMGFDPALDPNSGITEVPLITGACVMLRRTDFDAIGGWDSGYLIGDYEDSELCMRLRDRGMRVAYLPGVDLVHLERQSFKGIGDDQFRQRVTQLNAVRYRDRWNAALQAMCEVGAA